MYESATQQFLNNVVLAVRRTAPIPSAVSGFKEEDKDGNEGEEKGNNQGLHLIAKIPNRDYD